MADPGRLSEFSRTRRRFLCAAAFTAASPSTAALGGMVRSPYFAFRGIRKIVISSSSISLNPEFAFISNTKIMELAQDIFFEYQDNVLRKRVLEVGFTSSTLNRGLLRDDDALLVNLQTYVRRISSEDPVNARAAGRVIAVLGIACQLWRRRWPDLTAPAIQNSLMSITPIDEDWESSAAAIKLGLRTSLIPLMQTIVAHNEQAKQ